MCVPVRLGLVGISSLLPACGSPRWSSDLQARQQSPLSTKPSCRPQIKAFKVLIYFYFVSMTVFAPVCICTSHMQCLWKPEGDVGFPRKWRWLSTISTISMKVLGMEPGFYSWTISPALGTSGWWRVIVVLGNLCYGPLVICGGILSLWVGRRWESVCTFHRIYLITTRMLSHNKWLSGN